MVFLHQVHEAIGWCWSYDMHVDQAHRVCLACNSGAVGDEMHLLFECTALAFVWSRYASLFTGGTDTMMSFFAQPDHIGVFHNVVDCPALQIQGGHFASTLPVSRRLWLWF